MSKKYKKYTIQMIGDNNIDSQDAMVIAYYAMNNWEDFEPNYKYVIDDIPVEFDEKNLDELNDPIMDEVTDKVIEYEKKLRNKGQYKTVIAYLFNEKNEAIYAFEIEEKEKGPNIVVKYNKEEIKNTIENRLGKIKMDDVQERYQIARIYNSKRKLKKFKKGIILNTFVAAIGEIMLELSKRNIENDLQITHSTRTLNSWINALYYLISIAVLAFGAADGVFNIVDYIAELLRLKKAEKNLSLIKK